MTLRSWLGAIAEIARAVNQSLPLRKILDLIAGSVCRLTGQRFCAVLLADTAEDRLAIEGWWGLSEEYVEEVNLRRPIRLDPGPLADGPSSRAFRSQRPVQVADTSQDPSFGRWEAVAFDQGYRSVLSVPLIASGTPVGVLNAYRSEPHDFDEEEILLLETLANQAAIAIEAATLRSSQQATISRLEEANRSLQDQRAALERAHDAHREMMQVVLEDSGLEAITSVLARALQAPVAAEDRTGHELAAAAFGDRRLAVPSPESETDPPLPEVHERLATEGHIVEVQASGGETLLVAPVVVSGELAGRVWVLAPQGGFRGLERQALERAAVVVALEMLKRRTASEVEARLSRDLLGDLLSLDERTDREALRARAANLGHDLSLPHALFLVRLDSRGVPAQRRPGEPQADGGWRRVLSFVRAIVTRQDPRPVVATRHGDVVVLWPIPSPTGRPTPEELGRSLCRAAPGTLSGATVSVALGGICERLADYAEAYRSASTALRLSEQGGGRGRFVTLDDLGIYRFLLQVDRPEQLVSFADGVLGPLLAYDRDRGTALVPTLRAYLANRCAVGDTAERLYVHPNTVAYRIRRIQELLDRDLRQPEALLAVQFALMTRDLMHEGGTGESGEYDGVSAGP